MTDEALVFSLTVQMVGAFFMFLVMICGAIEEKERNL
jgi:hypothetical protein